MEIPALYARRIESRIAETLQDTPVVLLAGPRQAGKTTLVRQIAADNGLRYLSLDDELTLLSLTKFSGPHSYCWPSRKVLMKTVALDVSC